MGDFSLIGYCDLEFDGDKEIGVSNQGMLTPNRGDWKRKSDLEMKPKSHSLMYITMNNLNE